MHECIIKLVSYLQVINQNLILPSPAVNAKAKKVEKRDNKNREKDMKSKKSKDFFKGLFMI